MKKFNIALAFLFGLILVFQIYKYSINDAWNKTEKIVFTILLDLAPINSVILLFQNKKAGIDKNKTTETYNKLHHDPKSWQKRVLLHEIPALNKFS
jgi:undecaprenyl pyrophosphate phosphatase UppP